MNFQAKNDFIAIFYNIAEYINENKNGETEKDKEK